MADAEYYKSLPMKRMAAGALFFDEVGNILIVKPSYKNVWEIPGGVVEKDESPRKAAEREIQEELGLRKHFTRLLCVDYQNPYDIKTESLMFIFDGGKLDNEEAGRIKVDGREITEFRFVPLEMAMQLLSPVLARRVQQSVAAYSQQNAVYLEDRELIL